jgi:phosphoglycolate phosphatase
VSYLAVMFDLDGTLLDTVDDLADAANAVLEDFGYPTHPTDAYCEFLGDGVYVLFERALPEGEATDGTIDRIVPAMKEIYSRRWQQNTTTYPGVPALLDELTDRGLHLTICSNKPDAFARRMVDALMGEWQWGSVLGQRDGVPIKPDPAGPMEIVTDLGIEPGQVLYVGDTNTDMLTARNCGFYGVGCEWGWRDRRELEQAGADAVIAAPAELLQLL